MRLAVVPETVMEWLGLRAGLAPVPLFDTLVAMWLSRTIIVACKVGVFEALRDGGATTHEVALRCEADPGALEKMLGALVGARYLTWRAGRYALTARARRWLLPGAPQSLHDNMVFRLLEWDLLDHYEAYIRHGTTVDLHRQLTTESWAIYPAGMRALAALTAEEVAKRAPIGRRARTLLDLGGAHGLYAATLCRRHPLLEATVLDLPDMAREAAALIEREGLGARLRYRTGDATKEDLGHETYDVVFVSHLVHHLDAAQNEDLMRRIARALRPEGVVIVQEIFRPKLSTRRGQAGALGDLYFGMLSASGTWTHTEVAAWQEAASLHALRPIWLRSVPGTGLQAARR
ncbi:MAG: class I SAM-dependent methyltransferase [Myxococcota bacterium]